MTKLYYSPGSCSMAPHIALEETGVPYEEQAILLAKRENLTPEYLAVHPRGFVPVLDTGTDRFTEAAAILLHVARRSPEAALLPEGGSPEEARVFEWLCWMTNTLHVAYAGLWRPERFTDDKQARSAIVDEAKGRIDAMNQSIEQKIARWSYAASNDYTIADPFLLVFFRWANRIGLDAAGRFPSWTRWARRMQERPAVARVLAREQISLWE